jgi:parallel beta-helix repeat protein
MLAFPAPVMARVVVVHTTIQAAVDAAHPGDTILVPPGNYRETVLVNKSGLTIAGPPSAVLDAGGARSAIRVGTGTISRGGPEPSCPPLAVKGFTLLGMTIKNAASSAVFLVGVDGYRLTGTKYVANPIYGPFPICSTKGRIDFNRVVGATSTDTGIYVGDDDTVTVQDNFVTGYVIGVVIENSLNAVVRDNLLTGNTSGVYVAVFANHPHPLSDNVLIERNEVLRNNMPNPVPADSGSDSGLIPTGAGIVNLGGDRVVIRNNRVIGNDSLGVAIVQNQFAPGDPRVEINPDFNKVLRNVILQNGRSPDPVRAITPGVDIVYDGSGTGTCFAGNVFATEFPAGITELFPCS